MSTCRSDNQCVSVPSLRSNPAGELPPNIASASQLPTIAGSNLLPAASVDAKTFVSTDRNATKPPVVFMDGTMAAFRKRATADCIGISFFFDDPCNTDWAPTEQRRSIALAVDGNRALCATEHNEKTISASVSSIDRATGPINPQKFESEIALTTSDKAEIVPLTAGNFKIKYGIQELRRSLEGNAFCNCTVDKT